MGGRNPSSTPAETLLLKFWHSSGDWRFLNQGPDDPGEVKDVAAVDAVLTGDQSMLCLVGVNEELVLGIAFQLPTVFPAIVSIGLV